MESKTMKKYSTPKSARASKGAVERANMIPSKMEILKAYWGGSPECDISQDVLLLKTHGKLRTPCDVDVCWCCHAIEDHPEYDIKIQRCHVIPKSLRGSNDPLNFVLLCDRCHRHSPDIHDKDSIFAWMEMKEDEHQEYVATFIDLMKRTFPEANSGDRNFGLIKIYLSDEFREYRDANTTWHFGVLNKASTQVAALAKYIKEKGYLPSLNYQLPTKVVDLNNENIEPAVLIETGQTTNTVLHGQGESSPA